MTHADDASILSDRRLATVRAHMEAENRYVAVHTVLDIDLVAEGVGKAIVASKEAGQ